LTNRGELDSPSLEASRDGGHACLHYPSSTWLVIVIDHHYIPVHGTWGLVGTRKFRGIQDTVNYCIRVVAALSRSLDALKSIHAPPPPPILVALRPLAARSLCSLEPAAAAGRSLASAPTTITYKTAARAPVVGHACMPHDRTPPAEIPVELLYLYICVYINVHLCARTCTRLNNDHILLTNNIRVES
jgi:hypothetical protein